VAELELSTLDGPGSPLVLSMVGKFDLSNVDPLKNCLAAWVLEGTGEAVIDLTRTDFIDSTVIGTLVTAHLAGLMITVRGASGVVRHALDVAGIDEVLTMESAPTERR
jgi:anti-anti-sigma factor